MKLIYGVIIQTDGNLWEWAGDPFKGVLTIVHFRVLMGFTRMCFLGHSLSALLRILRSKPEGGGLLCNWSMEGRSQEELEGNRQSREGAKQGCALKGSLASAWSTGNAGAGIAPWIWSRHEARELAFCPQDQSVISWERTGCMFPGSWLPTGQGQCFIDYCHLL